MCPVRWRRVPAIVERTNRDHPYDVPCVIAVPIVGGNPAYIRWVIDQTEPVVSPASDAA